MFCSISGNAPESPVVSKITGHVYEKSLLEKYLVAEGKVCPPFSFFSVPLAAGSCSVPADGSRHANRTQCPVTKEEMTMDDVVDVQSAPPARPLRVPAERCRSAQLTADAAARQATRPCARAR